MKYTCYFLLVILFITTACNDDGGESGPAKPVQIINNGGSISATLIDSLGNESPWSADLVRIVRYQGWVMMKTNVYLSGEKFSLEMSNHNPGFYFRNFEEYDGPQAKFEPHRDSLPLFYASTGFYPQTTTEFSIVYDTLNHTASGTFDVILAENSLEPSWRLANGVFDDVPYNASLLNVNGEVRADMDGVPMHLDYNTGFVLNSDNTLDFSLNDVMSGESIGIRIPRDIDAGYYQAEGGGFSENGLAFQNYNLPPPGITAIENAQLNIHYHNTENRTIAGDFSFEVPTDSIGPGRQVSNGYFEFLYNDWR